MRKIARTRATLAAVTALVLAGGLGACSGSDDSDSGAGAGSVLVGLDFNLTGAGAGTYGIPQQRGAELALAEIQSSGVLDGIDFTTEVKDDATEDAQSVTVFNKFVSDGAVIVFQSAYSSAMTAIAPFAERKKVPLLNLGGAGVGDDKPDYVFRMSDLGQPQSNLGTYLVEQRGAKRVAIIVDGDNVAMVGLSKAFTAAVEEAGGSIVTSVTIASADTDFTSSLAQIAAEDPDALAILAAPPQSGNILSQAKDSGDFDDTIMAGQTGWSGQVAEIAGSAADGALFPAIWLPGEERSADFEKQYQEEYGEPVTTSAAALAHDALWLAAVAVKTITDAGDEVTGEAMREALPEAASTDEYQEHALISGFELPESGAPSIAGVVAQFGPDGQIVAAQ